MPNITHGGVFYEPGHEPPGWVPPVPEPEAELPPPPAVSALKAEHVEYATEVLGVPAVEAEAMTKPDLVDLARTAPPRVPPRSDAPPGAP